MSSLGGCAKLCVSLRLQSFLPLEWRVEGLKSGLSVGMQAAMIPVCNSRLWNHNEMSVLAYSGARGQGGTYAVCRTR